MQMVTFVTILAVATLLLAVARVTNAFRPRVLPTRPERPADLAPPPRVAPVIGDEEQLNAEEQQLEAKIREAALPCWKPVTEAVDGGRLASKFGGVPYLTLGEDWPRCNNCGKELQLFLQLNASTAPTTLPFSGLLQFFYCTNTEADCEVTCEAWAPQTKSTFLRIVHTAGDGKVVTPLPASANFAPRTITSWSQAPDYPHYEDLVQLGIDVPNYLVGGVFENYVPEEGDKLLGWPSWVQGAEYPSCPVCNSRMIVLFQIASEDNIPYMFGDLGTGHVSSCPIHPAELAFGWACS